MQPSFVSMDDLSAFDNNGIAPDIFSGFEPGLATFKSLNYLMSAMPQVFKGMSHGHN